MLTIEQTVSVPRPTQPLSSDQSAEFEKHVEKVTEVFVHNFVGESLVDIHGASKITREPTDISLLLGNLFIRFSGSERILPFRQRITENGVCHESNPDYLFKATRQFSWLKKDGAKGVEFKVQRTDIGNETLLCISASMNPEDYDFEVCSVEQIRNLRQLRKELAHANH